MTQRLSLAAVGWVAEHPTGNRLRFTWPWDAAAGGHHILPNEIVVERAPIDAEHNPRGVSVFGPAAAVPPSFWKPLGDVTLAGFTPTSRSFGGSVQAVRFLYEGTPAIVSAFDGSRCVVVRPALDGQWVFLQASAIDQITITAPFCKLQSLATLDLYATLPLPFTTIASIELSATATASFAHAATRYPAPPTLDAGKWVELQTLWKKAWAETPGAAGADGAPNAWQELQIVLGVRWEHAVFAGLGFVDGPDNGTPAIDHWHALLTAPRSVAYRVRDASGRLHPSNIVCIPAGPASALPVLPAPGIEQGAVRLGSSGAIRASWDVSWKSPDPGIIGVQVQETRVVGTATEAAGYDGRGRRPTDPPGAGFVHREEQVGSDLVRVGASVRAQDGFDRIGPVGPSSPLTQLAIDHHPQPPLFRAATNDGATAILTQAVPAWTPDALAAAAAGTIRIFRRVKDRARLETMVLQAIPTGAQIVVKLDGPPPPVPSAFIGGQISAGALSGTVTALSWPAAVVALPAVSGGPVAAVAPGTPVALTQSATDPALFVQVHERAAVGFPQTISFPDPVASPPPALFEYRGQVAFAGLVGPLGSPVQAFVLPPTPVKPPPFTVTVLGVDFYHRTVVQVDLTTPSSDRLELWWADGNVADADFAHNAVPGDAGVRRAEADRTLFDTLSLPVPKMVDRLVTIGVQGVNPADGRGAFTTVRHTLHAAP